MSDVYERVAERMAMVMSTDDDAYAIMARQRVRAIAGSEPPTIDHYHQALTKCIADKAADWRAACKSALEASKELARLRLTDAERQAIAWVCGDVADITGPIKDTLRRLLERHFPAPEN